MSDREHGSLRVVGPTDAAPPGRRRGPGIAFIAVVAYGLLFLFSLFYFSGSKVPAPKPKVEIPAPTRESLLAGTGLSGLARDRYFSRIAADRCDCGCDMTLVACLARDQRCVRSPALAGTRMRALAAASRP